jgi:hypothetical protein
MLKRPKNKAISVAISTLCIGAASLWDMHKGGEAALRDVREAKLLGESQVPPSSPWFGAVVRAGFPPRLALSFGRVELSYEPRGVYLTGKGNK